jgi:hypothetical protein
VEIPIPPELVEELADRVAERLAEKRRWAEIEGVADYLGCSIRRVRDLRERGLPAKRIGRRLILACRPKNVAAMLRDTSPVDRTVDLVTRAGLRDSPGLALRAAGRVATGDRRP